MFNWWGSAQTQETKETEPKEGEGTTTSTGVQEANQQNISEIDYAKDVAKNVGSRALFYRMYRGFKQFARRNPKRPILHFPTVFSPADSPNIILMPGKILSQFNVVQTQGEVTSVRFAALFSGYLYSFASVASSTAFKVSESVKDTVEKKVIQLSIWHWHSFSRVAFFLVLISGNIQYLFWL